MANTKSALKAMRNSERKRLRNRIVKSSTRTYIKRARLAIESGDVETAQGAVQRAIVALDKAAAKGIIHKNNTARCKSRLTKHFNNMRKA